MRTLASALLGLFVASVCGVPALAQAWLTVADADGRFRLEMPVPFDLPPSQTEPDGTFSFAYVHETPELALRFEVIDSSAFEPAATAHLSTVSRYESEELVQQVRVHVAGHRTYRLIATSSPELESDPMIQRFLASMRLRD